MKVKTAQLFLMKIKWQRTPQLSLQKKFKKRQLLKAFGIYKIMKNICKHKYINRNLSHIL